jgi:hypothetical protein
LGRWSESGPNPADLGPRAPRHGYCHLIIVTTGGNRFAIRRESDRTNKWLFIGSDGHEAESSTGRQIVVLCMSQLSHQAAFREHHAVCDDRQ